ncbi:MAG: hypothetical protein IPI91_20835 [Flavobacteriales bacterium]|nr:hypothetical protein [Flavobacteriales bacterium]
MIEHYFDRFTQRQCLVLGIGREIIDRFLGRFGATGRINSTSTNLAAVHWAPDGRVHTPAQEQAMRVRHQLTMTAKARTIPPETLIVRTLHACNAGSPFYVGHISMRPTRLLDGVVEECSWIDIEQFCLLTPSLPAFQARVFKLDLQQHILQPNRVAWRVSGY